MVMTIIKVNLLIVEIAADKTANNRTTLLHAKSWSTNNNNHPYKRPTCYLHAIAWTDTGVYTATKPQIG